ncbi:MAG TPA: sigma-70 family RNA polymerase sigma factor [Candidatus Sulfotelmatobacter sp.]|nr:sigma-70 family RNA polymerase sigma factor [Candidatus Sulfotelmatobacter sp.]
MTEQARVRRFEQVALPHLDAAYNLARWLTRNDADAEDVVQEAFLRAFRFFDGYRGGSDRAWLLTIVRHTCYSWLQQNRPAELIAGYDIEAGDLDQAAIDPSFRPSPGGPDPEIALLQQADEDLLNEMIGELPPQFREVMILRELEDLSYKEIAEVAAIPIGTVMSRLARARKALQGAWARRRAEEARHGV